jgi:predicted ATPase
MRIAGSGTHCSGKSTLIDAFLIKHRDYIHESEANEALQELHGYGFAAEPNADDFFRQLEFQVERLREYRSGDCVVFERSPLDYVAYQRALIVLNRDTADTSLAQHSNRFSGRRH